MSTTAGPSRNARRRHRSRGGPPSQARPASTAAVQVPARPPQPQLATVQAAPQLKDNTHISTTRFADLHARGFISKQVLDNIPFEFCTEVQAATLETILTGVDVFARAKTGTGKTVAFLLPIIQNLTTTAPQHGKISALIIAPTRDLALQIQTEAQKLIQGMPIRVQVFIGGTNMNTEKARLNQRIDILVATPGRLQDHLDNSGLKPKLSNLQTFVLDEADRLLDEGFMPAVKSIIAALPNRAVAPRQSLLFSATVAPKVRNVAQLALLPNHKFISTVKDEDSATHEHVPQTYSLISLESQLAAAAAFLHDAGSDKNNGPTFKAIVFVNTAREAALYHQIFDILRPAQLPAFEMHSRLTQKKRDKEIAAFKEAGRGVMFASDVIARGIDIPDVSAVLQVGAPAVTDTYIHRLGRTARAGKEGRGHIFLDPAESSIVPKITNKVLVQANSPANLAEWQAKVDSALNSVDDDVKSKVYAAWIGFNKTSKWYKLPLGELLQKANRHALQTLRYKGDGSGRPPPIPVRTAGKMGIKGPERNLLHIVKDLPRGN